jgi:hypothetical protein
MFEYIFFIIFVIVGGTILYVLFSERGKRSAIERIFGKIENDYGQIGTFKIPHIPWEIKFNLYKCDNGQNSFFVLSAKYPGKINFIPIPPDLLSKIIEVKNSEK